MYIWLVSQQLYIKKNKQEVWIIQKVKNYHREKY